jgi:hypothetical protein
MYFNLLEINLYINEKNAQSLQQRSAALASFHFIGAVSPLFGC